MRIVSGLIAALLVFGAGNAFAQDGAALYQKSCGACHGADGKAQTPAAKAMKVPAIAGTSMSANDIVAKLKASEKHKNVVGKLSDAELSAIVAAIPKG